MERERALRAVGTVGALAAVVAFALPPPRSAAAAQPTDGRTCLQPGETGPEVYGPTDINAVTGNQRLTAAVNSAGTISVLRWPSPSYGNQIRYRTISANLPRNGVAPNEGSFLGIVRGGRTEWLRDLPASQTNPDDSSDAVATTYTGEGFVVAVTDVIDGATDVLAREVRVAPPGAVDAVVAFAHFAPTVVHVPDFPTYDWCQQDLIAASASYDQPAQAVVTGAPGVALAVGFSGDATGHQVGTDAYWAGAGGLAVPADAYDDAADGRLSGASMAPGPQVDMAVTSSLDVGGRAVFLVAAGADRQGALATLAAARRVPFERALAGKHDLLAAWMAPSPLPAAGDAVITSLVRRTYISIWQATDRRGAVVASIATQSPYGEDWPRDSSFINHLLDVAGHGDVVARHNRFLADVQIRAGRPPPLGTLTVPPGNWAMNYYADGTVGGPIPWEIDETGLGAWTLYDHFSLSGDRAYLADVYPAIAAAADFLSGAGRDPATDLTIPASEDDHPEWTYPPTMHASGPVLLGLRAAAASAVALGQTADATRWRTRGEEVATAIDTRYHAAANHQAWTDDFGDGGWALWPVEVQPQTAARMRAQAAVAADHVLPSFDAPAGGPRRGAYEGKALLGLARNARATGDPNPLATARRGLQWVAHVQASRGTHLLGEVWVVRGGRVVNVVSQPHVWEMTLFTLAALEAWPATDAARGNAVPAAAPLAARRPLPTTGDSPTRSAAGLMLCAAGLAAARRGAARFRPSDGRP